ncbi:MAG: cobyrinate a,c-diamide synthase [Proteobacteria bacterium]|nr:cobyrinate a,c-diamide synthase [Pseudomonadota bacterium]
MSHSLPGVIIAAPASGSGKSTVTLGLLRHLRDAGASVVGAKVGPDYIDPAFHAAASGKPCRNLDGWAMGPATLAAAGRDLEAAASLVICEGVMGLFDGATGGGGSTADIAALTGWPVVLVIDARGQAASAAATLRGFASHRDDVRVAGVIFNRIGGAAHDAILRQACAAALPHIAVLGCLPRDARLTLPERHLGLVPAGEHGDLDAFLAGAAAIVAEHVDVAALTALARPWVLPVRGATAPLPILGGRIAVAMDQAFAFHYPAVLDGWRRSAEIVPFSPLADEAPDPAADAVYLPGGYPELHAGRLAGNSHFLDGLRAAAARGAAVYGECGGYMVMGAGLTDASGTRHAMAGLLDLETTFAERRLHLGYRKVRLSAAGPLGPAGAAYRGHEFHYSTVLSEGGGQPLFLGEDSNGGNMGGVGRRHGAIMGSFVHLIDRDANG